MSDARDDVKRLLTEDPKRPPRAFKLALSRPMGTKRGRGDKSFVRETRQQAIDFYRDLVQDLRAWQRAPAKLPDEPADDGDRPQPDPPPFSAAESHDPGEAPAPEHAPFSAAYSP